LRLASDLDELSADLISFGRHFILQGLDHHFADPFLSLHFGDLLNNYPCLSLPDLSFGLLPYLLVAEELSEPGREPVCLDLFNARPEVSAFSSDDTIKIALGEHGRGLLFVFHIGVVL
jgi:hypothetical protein